MNETIKSDPAKMMEERDERHLRMLVEKIPDMVAKAVQGVLPSTIDRLTERLGLSSEVFGLLHLLAGRSDESYEDTLRKALTLYSYALDALEKDNRLAILNADDEIVHEIVGFDAPTETHQTTSR